MRIRKRYSRLLAGTIAAMIVLSGAAAASAGSGLAVSRLTLKSVKGSPALGYSVAAQGGTVVVGAPTSPGGGAAYVFQRPATGWSDVHPIARLRVNGPKRYSRVGIAVAMHGRTIAVTDPNSIGANTTVNHVYLFHEPKSGWASTSKPTAILSTKSTPPNPLGDSIAMTRSTIVVGDASLGFSAGAGQAYVYTKPAGGWRSMTQTAIIKPDHRVYNFGISVGVSGDTIVVSGGEDGVPGAAYVYVKPSSGGWTNTMETRALFGDGETHGDFGLYVAIAGKDIAVTEPNAMLGGNAQAGQVLIFARPLNGWGSRGVPLAPVATLTLAGTPADELLGSALTMNHSQVLAQASTFNGAEDVDASVAAYTEPPTGWADATPTTVLHNPHEMAGDLFGWAMALTPSYDAIGARGRHDNRGEMYVYSSH